MICVHITLKMFSQSEYCVAFYEFFSSLEILYATNISLAIDISQLTMIDSTFVPSSPPRIL